LATYSSMTYGALLKRRMLARAIVCSTAGAAIEFFDFALFGLVVVAIGAAFFPSRDPLASTLSAFVTFGAGFLARPIGAVVFGHVGDRIGRKATLIVTLLGTGTATVLMGLVPTYAQIGIWGPIFITILRLAQGLSLGGEWAGSVLLTVEWGDQARRGLLGALPQIGIPLGVALGTSSALVSSTLVHDPYWSWRLPFLASIVLVALGLYLRLGVLETPVFAQLLEERRTERHPVQEVLRRQWRDVVVISLMRAGEQTPTLIFTSFGIVYSQLVLKLPFTTALHYSLFYLLLSAALVPILGWVSDVVGRKWLYLTGAAAMALWALPFWRLLDTRDPSLILLAYTGAALAWTAMAGPQAAFFAETFTGRMRYSGSSIGYQLAALTAGGPALIVATYLLSRFHSGTAIGLYVLASAVVSFAFTLVMRERSRQDLSVEYDEERRDAPPRPFPFPSKY